MARNLATKLDEVLCCSMIPNDANAKTVGDYLLMVLSRVWQHQGNLNWRLIPDRDDWQEIIYQSLAEEELIDATVDDEGEYLKIDRATGNTLVKQAIDAMWSAGK